MGPSPSGIAIRLGDVAYRIMSRLQMGAYERYLAEKLKGGPVPRHVGVILDGNRRFARSQGLDLRAAYRLGAKKAREILDWCVELGIDHVTLYSLSTENLRRRGEELEAVLDTLREEISRVLREDLGRLRELGVSVRFIGRMERLPEDLRALAERLEEETRGNGGRTLNVAVAYGGRAEIVDAVRRIAEKVASGEILPGEINEDTITRHTYLADVPSPDLIIRTSGEERISNFLLWHSAYSELMFLDVYLPALRKVDFLRAIREYQRRSRRFGR